MRSNLDRLIDSAAKRCNTPSEAQVLANTAWLAASDAGLTICDLKPLAYNMDCEPEMGALMEALRVAQQKWSVGNNLKPLAELLGCEPVMAHIVDRLEQRRSWVSQRFAGRVVAQALNWERTEFDTLDELLGAIREQEQNHSNFVDQAIVHYELTDAVREKLCLLAETSGSRAKQLLDECVALPEPRNGGYIPASEPVTVGDVMNAPSPGMYMQQLGRIKRPATTHTILHAGELYRDATVLLQTNQLVAWRTADGQEYCQPARSVTIDPSEDGVAAEILSRIGGYDVAPEHIEELRAQMNWGSV